VLRVARSSARKDRVRALNQLRSLISTAPEELRRELRVLRPACAPNGHSDVVNATKLASLARRVREIDAEIAELDAVLDAVLRPLVAETAPRSHVAREVFYYLPRQVA